MHIPKIKSYSTQETICQKHQIVSDNIAILDIFINSIAYRKLDYFQRKEVSQILVNQKKALKNINQKIAEFEQLTFRFGS